MATSFQRSQNEYWDNDSLPHVYGSWKFSEDQYIFSKITCRESRQLKIKQEALHMQRDRVTRHIYEISYLKMFAIGEWPSRILKVITIARLDRPYYTSITSCYSAFTLATCAATCCRTCGQCESTISGLLLQHLYLAPFPIYYHFSCVCDCCDLQKSFIFDTYIHISVYGPLNFIRDYPGEPVPKR